MKWSKKTNRLMSMEDSLWFRTLSKKDKLQFTAILRDSMEEDKRMHRATQGLLNNFQPFPSDYELKSVDIHKSIKEHLKWDGKPMSEIKKSNTMKIEVGKFYKTNNGAKAIIYAVYEFEIHGAVLSHVEEGVWWIRSWKHGGSCKVVADGSHDIVSEWQEPLDFDWNCLPAWADGIVKQGTGWNYYFGRIFYQQPLFLG